MPRPSHSSRFYHPYGIYITSYSKTLSASNEQQQKRRRRRRRNNKNSRLLQAAYQSGFFSILLIRWSNPSNARQYAAIRLREISRANTATQAEKVGSTLKWTLFIIWVIKLRMMGRDGQVTCIVENPGVDGRIVLKCIWQKQNASVCTGYIHVRLGTSDPLL